MARNLIDHNPIIHSGFSISYTCLALFLASVVIDPNEGFLRNGKDPVLAVFSAGHALHVFVNGQLSGEQDNAGLQNFSYTQFNY